MNQFRSYIQDIQQTIDLLPVDAIEAAVTRMHQARLDHQQIFVMGNGGSAATASHMACDLGKNTVATNYPRIRIHALTDNMPFFSAYGNDCGYETVFAEQLATYVDANDVVVAISASGNSANVLNAVELAQKKHAYTIGWSGYDGGKLATMVDLPIVVPCHNIEQIEDIHMMLSHMMTMGLRNAVQKPMPFASNGTKSVMPALIAN